MFTHIPKVGYVGMGTVSGEPRPFADAVLTVDGESRHMPDLLLQGSYRPDSGSAASESDTADRRERIVPVDWEQSMPQEKAFWRTGLFANQNSACKLRARFTIEEVSRYFGIE
ncbi:MULTISPECIES: hypothetical protein [unclassified Streptomyces]|uniref:hypothetical protein n=1 Tax=unclassified Streptomyces TaxID=2593676 RepID=UPI0036E7CA97